MIVPSQGFKRKYAFGGSGIFDSMGNIISGIVLELLQVTQLRN